MTSEDLQKVRNITVNLLPGDEPLDEETIVNAVDRAITLIPLAPDERATLIRELQAIYTIAVGAAGMLDAVADHIEWLDDQRESIEWNLWERYRRYLNEIKGFPPLVVSRLDDTTDQLLGRIENPNRPGAWDRRGMVVGHVQSGKTSNYIGLTCKAADAGYKVIIILAGLNDSLRSQTQLRIDEGVLGFDTQKRRSFDRTNSRIGVGRLPGAKLYPVNSLTSSAQKGDFKKSMAQQVGVNPRGTDPLILVVKKNKSILNNLISWLTSFDAQQAGPDGQLLVRQLPLLLIDDECDHASVNTHSDDPDLDPTAINASIRNLLSSFEQSAYIGYTATPFANIFITPDSTAAGKHGEDLFPRDFIVSLKRPSNYIGASRVFGLVGDTSVGIESIEPLPIVKTVDDNGDWVPSSHKNGHSPGPMPDSLSDAIRDFILVCAARRVRGQETEHNSMLIHVTRFVSVQEAIAEQVENELSLIKQRIRYGDGTRTVTIRDELRERWESGFTPVTEKIDDPSLDPIRWSDIEPELESAVTKIQVRTVNGRSIEALEYFDRPNGISVIAIGGAKLSRGLTLEGLSVSYYLRTSRMYDTLLQMGRWFGYRPGYMDLCRLYTTADLQRWYAGIALANEDLLVQFEEMALRQATPSEFGLRVRQSADGLTVTSAGKMRHGTKMRLTFSGAISETILFDLTKGRPAMNLAALQDFVTRIESTGQRRTPEGTRQKDVIWDTVPGEEIIEFLSEFRTHAHATKAQAATMAEYIRGRVRSDPPELTDWTVALLSNPGDPIDVGGHRVGRTRRAPFPSDSPISDVYAIRRLLSPNDERLDLTPDELELAEARTREWVEAGLIQTTAEPSKAPINGRAVRSVRPPQRGLLLVYLLDEKELGDADLGVPIVGLAVSFPHTQNLEASTIEYVVNHVYFQEELGLE